MCVYEENGETQRERERERERAHWTGGCQHVREHEVGVFGCLESLDARVEPPAAHVVPEARVHRGYAESQRVLSSGLHIEALGRPPAPGLHPGIFPETLTTRMRRGKLLCGKKGMGDRALRAHRLFVMTNSRWTSAACSAPTLAPSARRKRRGSSRRARRAQQTSDS